MFNVFSVEKNRVAKIVFADKNRFCHINCEAICQNQACWKNIKIELLLLP